MTNKLAPYNNPEFMAFIEQWWQETCPEDKYEYSDMPVSIVDLYKSFSEFIDMTPFSPFYVDANQFAKCLVAAKIMNVGTWWARRPDWQPKEYEIRRARAF